MLSTMPGNEPALPLGASLLSAAQLDAVAGGSVYYDLFFWIGQKLGAIERVHSDLVNCNGGVAYPAYPM